MKTYHLQINGALDACHVHRLESDLRHLSGVLHASATAGTGHVTVHGQEGLMPLITHTVRAAGYEPASDRDTRGIAFARWYRHGWLTQPSSAA